MNPFLYAFLTAALGACGMLTQAPAQAPAQAPVSAPITAPPVFTAPIPVAPPSSVIAPTFGLTVVDETAVRTDATFATILITLAPTKTETWLRVLLPDGTVSPVTRGADCACIGLYAGGLERLRLDKLSGLRVETSDRKDGPYILAAFYK